MNRNLKSAALPNEFEKNNKSQAEGDRLLKSTGNKMVLDVIALNLVAFKFIDEVIQQSVDSKAVI